LLDFENTAANASYERNKRYSGAHQAVRIGSIKLEEKGMAGSACVAAKKSQAGAHAELPLAVVS